MTLFHIIMISIILYFLMGMGLGKSGYYESIIITECRGFLYFKNSLLMSDLLKGRS